jgi:hypothetical protein
VAKNKTFQTRQQLVKVGAPNNCRGGTEQRREDREGRRQLGRTCTINGQYLLDHNFFGTHAIGYPERSHGH